MTESHLYNSGFLRKLQGDFLKNPVFSNMDIIKQIKIYPPANDGTSRILVIYEVEDVLTKEEMDDTCQLIWDCTTL